MNRGWFITGTDTGVGKTRVARALLEGLARTGLSAVGMKPVASGCHATEAGWRSEDAQALMQASPVALDYAEVNPYAFEPAIAPHLAARAVGEEIRVEKILECFQRLQQHAPCVVVEGVGGWQVPIGDHQTMADVAISLQLPVILVVGLRLGCLNHALLTAEAVRRTGLKLAGWVANEIDPSLTHTRENIETLKQGLAAPLLARIPYGIENHFHFPPEAISRLARMAD